MTKKELRSLLGEGKTNQVLAELRSLSVDIPDLHNEVLQISAQLAENDRQRRLNLADPQDVKIEHNRINSVIIIIIDRLPDDLLRKKSSLNWEKVALWFGILAAVTGFTGYTLKDFFDKNDKAQIEHNKTNAEQRNEQPQSGNPTRVITEPAKNNSKKKDKPTEKGPKQEVVQAQPNETGVKTTFNNPEPSKAESKQKPQQYNSEVKDETGNGITGVEVYCPNCIIKKVKTDIEGNFTLEGYFEESATFWQSTITFSKDNKTKTETINWREKSPQPIKF